VANVQDDPIGFSCTSNESRGLRPERMLLLGYFDPRGISTVPETLASIQQFSEFKVTCLNLFDHRFDSGNLKLNPEIDLKRYDIVAVHNSVAYNPANLISLDALISSKFCDFEGVKVLFKQDENFRFTETAKAIASMKFDIVLTCLPSYELEKIYPSAVIGQNVKFDQMLTGYITPSLRSRFLNSSLERPIDIGYRGSIQPLDFGRLCYEKKQIGDEVHSRLARSGLHLDISSRWEERFGGEAWFEFLTQCKCVLGVESGASIFDLNGDLGQRTEAITRNIGPLSEDPTYCELFLKALEDLEGNIQYNQVSPRHFEAAACGTLQIMYPGQYSGIFIAGQHYLSLDRDFSNLSDVVQQVLDPNLNANIVNRAFNEIVLNKDFWIETFVKRLDRLILHRLEEKGRKLESKTLSKKYSHHGLLLVPHRVHLDPRLSWIAEGAPKELSIGLMGLQLGGNDDLSPLLGMEEFLGDMPILEADSSWLTQIAKLVGSDPAGTAIVRELFEIERTLTLSKIALCERYGASTSSKRLDNFRWNLRYLLNMTRSLSTPALSINGLQFVIAADLPALLSALLLKAVFGTKVLYDAHEYWAENDSRAESFEILFWREMEKRLTQHADLCQVVSPGLAEILSKETGCVFSSIPNCTPIAQNFSRLSVHLDAREKKENEKVRFLFQGLLTQDRGLEELLHAWKSAPSNAQLFLRGPDSDFKSSLSSLVLELGFSNDEVVFLPPVSESELVGEAMSFDVGIIPYPPSNTNNINCCPNKLSQYMAAGLAILANDTNYVREIITKAKCGVVTDFARPSLLAKKISWLTFNESERKDMAVKASLFFNESFNWQTVSVSMYGGLISLVSDKPLTTLSSWQTLASSLYCEQIDTPSGTVILENNQVRLFILSICLKVWLRLPNSLRVTLAPLKRRFLSKGVW